MLSLFLWHGVLTKLRHRIKLIYQALSLEERNPVFKALFLGMDFDIIKKARMALTYIIEWNSYKTN